MPVLSRDLRSKLERTVSDACDEAERGARAALERLGIGGADAPAYLSNPEMELRNRLRAHARRLGDARKATRPHRVGTSWSSARTSTGTGCWSCASWRRTAS
jgi:hypothetical protein